MVSLAAAEVRVTICRLGPAIPEADTRGSSADAEEKMIRQTVETLNAAAADVIVLRDARDRRLCQRIAERLAGGPFGVVACSDFGPVSGSTTASPQLAILSRSPAFAAWTESASRGDGAPGGFVFAGIRNEEVDVWTYALESFADGGKTSPREAAASAEADYGPFLRHLVGQTASPGASGGSRARAFVIANDFELGTAAGLSAFEEVSRILRADGLQSMTVTDANRVSDPALADRSPATAPDMVFGKSVRLSHPAELIASGPSVATVKTYGLLGTGPAPASPAPAGTTHSTPGADSFDEAKQYFFWPVVIIGVVFLVWFFGHRLLESFRIRSSSAQSTANKNFSTALSRTTYVNRLATESSPVGEISQAPTETASTDVLPGRSSTTEDPRVADARDRLMPHLARMMKDKLLWRLLAQRSRTIQIHDASTRVVAELEQRLALIQSHFESRVRSYENRIAELERELATKESINRELLESKVQVARLTVEQAPPPRPKPSVVYTLRFGDLMAKKPTVNTRSRQQSETY